MMNNLQRKTISDKEAGLLLFFAAVIFGGWIRISIPISTGFPTGDGGLFYAMVEDIRENQFVLPLYVEYNNISIPFAYPPLGFYIAGFIGELFHFATLDILTWFPAIILTFAIPAFYYLANLMTESKMQAGMATVFYTLTPRAMEWLIMGGGITRSLGHLLQILAISQIYLLFRHGKIRYLASSVFFSIAVVLTHPEAAIHTIGIAVLLWLFFGKSYPSFRNALFVAIGTLIFTSPWWWTVLQRHGITPFLSAMQTGNAGPLQFSFLFSLFLPFNDEKLLTIGIVFAILGLFLQLTEKKLFLPAFFLFPFFVETRNAANVYILPMAMLAAYFVSFLLSAEERESKHKSPIIQKIITTSLVVYVVILSLFNAFILNSNFIDEKTVSKDIRDGMTWLKDNTDSISKVALFSGAQNGLGDFCNEWLPIISERNSITTAQGWEWVSSQQFSRLVKQPSLKSCYISIDMLACYESMPELRQADYIIVISTHTTKNLILNLVEDAEWDVVYRSRDLVIFKK